MGLGAEGGEEVGEEGSVCGHVLSFCSSCCSLPGVVLFFLELTVEVDEVDVWTAGCGERVRSEATHDP